MKTYVTLTDFVDTFKQSVLYKDKFSYGGLKALFEYLEDYEDDTQEEIQFDAIAIACEWTEYANLEQYNDHNESEFRTLEALREHTTVLEKHLGVCCDDAIGVCDNHDYNIDGFVILNY